jgi:hypothetical protein
LRTGTLDFLIYYKTTFFLDASDRTSNGNDIETKRNDTSIIGILSVSKQNEPTYSRPWKDRSEANPTIVILCRIEEITILVSPEFAGSKRKRTK